MPPGYDSERDAALEMPTTLEPRALRRTLLADKVYNTPKFVDVVRAGGRAPHVVQYIHARKARGAIDDRTTGPPHAQSDVRKRRDLFARRVTCDFGRQSVTSDFNAGPTGSAAHECMCAPRLEVRLQKSHPEHPTLSS